MGIRRIARIMAWLLAAGAWHAVPAQAATLESLLMPGPLHEAHAKLEADCGNCHDRTNRARQRELCMGCHEDVAADIRTRRGLHGRRAEIVAAQCSACHSEHRGRSVRITPEATPGFDHARTDFPLQGGHQLAPCSACHQSGKKFSEAPTACAQCHGPRDPHEGRLGRDCATCHATAQWREVDFDHGKTRFALHGRHAQLPCAGCHADNRWQDTPTACANCHAPDDVHRGARGRACADCHSQTSWSDARFDHEKQTGFGLAGAHAQAACQACHRSGRFEDQLPRDCAGCHRAIDAHAGRFGGDCATCHGMVDWKPAAFDHQRETGFALPGAHAKLGCHSCHVVPVSERKPSRQCAACHRADDVHAGTTGNDCAACHGTDSWRAGLRFDHDLTPFPLLGQHVAVPCASCHASRRFEDAGETCDACHRADDVHRGALGEDCARCHHPNGWNQWEFDHGRETGFGLSGAHVRLQCDGCHRRPPAEEKLSRECAACHSTDDVHLGQFGRRCESCHSTISFRRARPR